LQPVDAKVSHTAAPWAPGIERTVTGLGYELVEVERAPRGLLRVTIDRIPAQGDAPAPSEAAPDSAATTADEAGSITVEDCERVTRQLQYVLDVEGVPYERLEVSSPGLDRPLKGARDFGRFTGSLIELTLRAPLNGRKRFKGELGPGETAGAWRLVFDDGRGTQALDFRLDEIHDARLVPVLDFRGRHRGGAGRADRAASPRRGQDSKQGKGGARGAAADGGGQR
jgi:ribosome maturation factor RimP